MKTTGNEKESAQSIINIEKCSKVFKVKQKKSFWADLFAPQFKNVDAVNNISFSINRGEIVGFVGPNGAGKTTTIKMITGILWPSSGNISVEGISPQENRIKVVKNIGAVFGQRKSLWPELSVRDGLELIASFYGVTGREFTNRYAELSNTFGIRDFERTPFRKLSLGQQMRSELCAALMHKPKILLLDEPTIGLDIIAKHELIDFLKKINEKEKVTILLTSHDLAEIEDLCPRIIVINHGKVLYDGTVTKLIPNEVIVEYEADNKHYSKKIAKKDLKKFLLKLDSTNFSVNEVPLEDIIKQYFLAKKH